jgi:hypothetical protein
MRKILEVFLLILIIMSVMNVPVLAASKDSAQTAVVHNTRAELLSHINPEEAESRDYLIEEWYSEIRSIGNGQVSLYGLTRCNTTCDSVSVELQLQRWNGSNWSTIGTYVFEAFNTDYNWGLRTVSVSTGNHYRVKSYHRAEDGSIYDQTTAVTQAIYLN